MMFFTACLVSYSTIPIQKIRCPDYVMEYHFSYQRIQMATPSETQILLSLNIQKIYIQALGLIHDSGGLVRKELID
jgi:hypothetical protein